ncbi:eukaryotic protein implicated in cell cycle regulation [Schizosaccharomyces cryophilus OY26]|uniref:Eukaryotic protein implicated in cell cycle regulation n=1 Tax=Schizosaccharomyces cryophilus (strain OY26 / ATCC MYA-4695 / CBS 11777 / NBRC 106824 / NRRL Y48691) TaxID=653667 RepID=S9VT04_SCHCR|nr:eukaryotic protein implicated in cell cycle regulation [Schizosaccharomyces cryophilus OY26]EPY49289.1 eukaryotic protein implicated in cell cycle regulation [Schizosaccharomyces cryophilus OY26]
MAATATHCLSFAQFQRLRYFMDTSTQESGRIEFEGTFKDDWEDDLDCYFDSEEELFITAGRIFYSKLRVFQTVRNLSSKLEWPDLPLVSKKEFISQCREELESGKTLRNGAFYTILYLCAGVYDCVKDPKAHFQSIRENVELLRRFRILEVIYSIFTNWNENRKPGYMSDLKEKELLALFLSLIFFFLTVPSENYVEWTESARSLQPSLMSSLVQLFNDTANEYEMDLDNVSLFPLRQITFLIYKTCIRLWGTETEFQEKKKFIASMSNATSSMDKPKTTVLDYEVFRHEIATKYSSFAHPFYSLPLDREQTHILPTLNTDSFHKSYFICNNRFCSPENPSLPIPNSKSKVSTRREQFQTNQNLPFGFTPSIKDSSSPKSIIEAAELLHRQTKHNVVVEQLLFEREYLRHCTLQYLLGTDFNDAVSSLDFSHEKPPVNDPTLNFVSKSYDDLFLHLDIFVQLSMHLFYYTSKKVNKLYIEAFSSSEAAMQMQSINDMAVADSPSEEISEPVVKPLEKDSMDDLSELASGFFVSGTISYFVDTCELILYSLSGLFLMMLKWFRLSHVLRSERFAKLLYDNHFLEILSRYLSDKESSNHAERDMKCLRGGFFSFTAKSYKQFPNSPYIYSKGPSSRNTLITLNCLRVMGKVCKYHINRKELLVKIDMQKHLKKLLEIPHEILKVYTLKVLKLHIPYLGIKWKQANMNIITDIYLHCPLNLRDSWIFQENNLETQRSSDLQDTFLCILIRFYHKRLYGQNCKKLYDLNLLEEIRLKQAIEELVESHMMDYLPDAMWTYTSSHESPDFFDNELSSVLVQNVSSFF